MREVRQCGNEHIWEELYMKKRESFNNKWGFILACIGSAVGMGNIWMFPTRVSMYGGGSYLIPYFIFVVLIGFTGVIGEMSFGRATRSGPIDAFGIAMEKRASESSVNCWAAYLCSAHWQWPSDTRSSWAGY